MASISPESAWEFAEAIKSVVGKPTTKRRATVQSVDKDGTIWVQLPGSSTTTPIASTGANVQPGDTVLTELRGTSLHITENNTDPAVGTRQAGDIARQAAKPAVDAAKAAEGIAGEAKAIASATGQHFWDNDNGAHVTDVTREEWETAEADDFSDLSDAKPYHNLLMNSLGILLRRALNNLVSISRSAIAFYDGLGNAASNIVARFGSAGAQIGKSDECHVELDADSLNFVSGNSVPLVTMRIDPDSAQYWEATFTSDGTSELYRVDDADRFAITPGTMTGYVVLINGERTSSGAIQGVTTGGVQYINGVFFSSGTIPEAGAEIVLSVTAAARASLIVGNGKASVNPNVGNNTIIAGNNSFASGDNSIAVGYGAGASGEACAAFGASRATADYAFAAGDRSEATRQYSVALGYVAHAHAAHAVAIGRGVNAKSENQAVFGKYNENDTNGDYALIIGNGTADYDRSNAIAVKWDGTVETSGAVNLANTLTVDTFTKAYTAAANSLSGAITIDITKTGYTPLGIVGFACGAGGAAIEQASISGTTATLYIRNVTSSAISRNCTINVLYMAVV